MEHSTCRLTFTHQSKRQSSRFFAKRESRQTKLRLRGFVIGCSATAAFALGRVGLGILAALIFGIVDGLDGKQARVKIETTEQWEMGTSSRLFDRELVVGGYRF